MNTCNSCITTKQKSAVKKLNLDKWLKKERHKRIQYYKNGGRE